jgi:hypothetical protein
MYESKPSEVARKLEESGIRESRKAPEKIVISKPETP